VFGTSGFNALPAGECYDEYAYIGERAYFWSATECRSDSANFSTIYSYGVAEYEGESLKASAKSIRCVKDN
jgi:uncharacterized protein (TIGR02145 family)